MYTLDIIQSELLFKMKCTTPYNFWCCLVLVAWCHVVCALFIPEAWFANVQTMEPIVLKNVPPERFNKVSKKKEKQILSVILSIKCKIHCSLLALFSRCFFFHLFNYNFMNLFFLRILLAFFRCVIYVKKMGEQQDPILEPVCSATEMVVKWIFMLLGRSISLDLGYFHWNLNDGCQKRGKISFLIL